MWKVAELGGKYYGTVVEYDGEGAFKIWKPDYFLKPFASEREISAGWLPEDGYDHVEDQQSYKLACFLVEALNKSGFEVK
ncbi:hypothetical protein D3C85_378240 [compost metagenome]